MKNNNDLRKDMLLSLINYLQLEKITIGSINYGPIIVAIQALETAYKNKRTVYIMGNGGSASTASHLTVDFTKIIPGLMTKCLSDNIPTITAIANDFDYDYIFSKQLTNIKEKDIVIVLSGSGNSKNIIKAVELANRKKAITIGILGFDGGSVKEQCDIPIHINVNDMQISEDLHLMICHILTRCLAIIIGKK